MTSPYGNWDSETRTYNSMLQGKITSQVDAISGEQVNYTYNSLNRLATAVTSDNPNVTQWGQSFTYDGFGNLTDQTTIKGSAPELHVTFNESTNQQTGSSSDANGNPGYVNGSTATYDEENRLVSTGSVYSTLAYYGYAPGNKRVWRGIWTWDPNQYLSVQTTDEITFWGVSGQKLARYQITLSGSSLYAGQTEACYYFGSKLIKNGKGWVHTDRLGSIGKFYPYGVERPSATANGTEKFTGYFRDSGTGLDYADQRYESPGTGRFLTPDRMRGNPADPGSWNLYAYTRGDPINRVDPNGMQDEGPPSGYCDDPINFAEPICSCPNGICQPPPGTGGTDTPPQTPCYQDWQKVTNALFDVEDAVLDKVIHDSSFTQQQIFALADLLTKTVGGELVTMEDWTYASPGLAKQYPDPAYYQGGHFNLEVSFADLQSVLGSSGFQEFQKDELGRFDPDPGAGGGSPHGGAVRSVFPYDYFHLDSASATSDLVGLAMHFARDVIRGNIGNPCLDPAFNKP